MDVLLPIAHVDDRSKFRDRQQAVDTRLRLQQLEIGAAGPSTAISLCNLAKPHRVNASDIRKIQNEEPLPAGSEPVDTVENGALALG